MSAHNPLTLTIIDTLTNETVRESTDYTGYVPRQKDEIMIDGTSWEVQSAEYDWDDTINGISTITLYVRNVT